MNSSLDAYTEIRELAEFISDEYFPSSVVQPNEILENEGIRLIYGDFNTSFDGLLECREQRFYTYCNLSGVNDKSNPRVRFTLAHEAGHYFIDHHRNALKSGLAPAHPSFCEYRTDSIIENEADTFASHLLMPTQRFKEDAKSLTKGFEAIRILSGQYKTSLTSTALRYIDLAMDNAVLIKWNKNHQLSWRRHSDDSSHFDRHRVNVSFEKLAKGSATEKLISGNIENSNDVIETGSVASMWFNGIHSGWSNDTLLHEQAMHVGKYGWLTLLWPASF